MKKADRQVRFKKIKLNGIQEKTTADVDKAIKEKAKDKAFKEKSSLSAKIEALLYDYITR